MRPRLLFQLPDDLFFDLSDNQLWHISSIPILLSMIAQPSAMRKEENGLAMGLRIQDHRTAPGYKIAELLELEARRIGAIIWACQFNRKL